MARRKKKSSPIKSILTTLLFLLIAGGFMIFKGSTPEFLRQYIPSELHAIFYPARTGTGGSIAINNLPATAGNTTITSFSTAKTQLKKLYVQAGSFTTFYCGSSFDEEFNLDHSTSGFHYRMNETRANRVEWEHIVPAEAFGQSFPEWRDGHPDCLDSKGEPYAGRRCASKTSQQFKLMQADMYNLVPAIGEVNGDRSNYSYAMLQGELREYGACNMEIEDQKAEPPDDKFGDIARTYMYMEAAYQRGVISGKNVKLFEAWNRMDPVDKWECERARLIEKIQGNRNMIVANACQKAGL
ncbi:MAG: endonuclease [Candidatus Electrothrix aestuarii]|uniref:Endonuclease n=1 Tax=Candidatus Electrothrix aestuarii TaxID=3062594 RepID=A0AAU8LXR6_9BACT|nr:endonuclease [Candidatus Electrothrix aestuarii]WPD22577.1 MAG: endonuclease [Candidatus Electrothrix sp. GW3-3]